MAVLHSTKIQIHYTVSQVNTELEGAKKRPLANLVNQTLFSNIFGWEKGSGVTLLPYLYQIPRFWGLFIGVDRLKRIINRIINRL